MNDEPRCVSGTGADHRAASATVGLIVDFNSASYTLDLLDSLRGEPLRAVWIVENGESLAEELIDALDLPFDVYLKRSPNLGFGAGVTSGVSSARRSLDFHYIWLLNPDTRLLSGGLRELESLAASNEPVIVSPVLVQRMDAQKVWFAGGAVDLARGVVAHDNYGQAVHALDQAPHETSFLSGASQLMSLNTWDTVGGYRTDLFLYWEDVDFSLRAKAVGVKLIVAPAVILDHDEGGTSRVDEAKSPTYHYWMARNRIRVCGEHGPLPFEFWLVSAKVILAPFRQGPTVSSAAHRALAAARGTLAGIARRKRARTTIEPPGADWSGAPRPPRNPRVLNVVTQLERAGAQTLARWIHDSLTTSAETRTRFLYKKYASDIFSDSDCLVQHRPSSTADVIRMWRLLRDELRWADVVLAHTHFAQMLTLLAKPRSCRVVAVHHWPLDRYPLTVRIVLTVARRLGRVEREIFVSDAIVDPKAIGSRVIHNPVPGEAKARARNVSDPMSADILVVARHSPEKDLTTLIGAMTYLPDRTLHLIGEGAETQQLQRTAQLDGLSGRLQFVGSKSQTEVWAAMAQASVVVLPSKWEAMPMVLLEAVAQGSDLVVSDIPAHRFLIQAGAAVAFRTGDRQDLARAIRSTGDPSVRESLRVGRETVAATQSEAAMREKWLEVING